MRLQKVVFCGALFLLPVVTVGAAESLSELRKQIETIAAEAHGRVGVAAVLRETGESVGLNESAKFPMQSVYKLPIAMGVLAKVDAGELTLDQKITVLKSDLPLKDTHSPLRDKHPEGGVEYSVGDLIRAAVSVSDNAASDVLMRSGGGPEALNTYLGSLELRDIRIVSTEKAMALDNDLQYINSATPEAAVQLLRLLHEGRALSKSSCEFLMTALIETSTGPRRTKGLLPPGAIVAHKTGTSSATCNDIGIVTLANGKHVALAVFVTNASVDLPAREDVIARIARATRDHWNQGNADKPPRS